MAGAASAFDQSLLVDLLLTCEIMITPELLSSQKLTSDRTARRSLTKSWGLSKGQDCIPDEMLVWSKVVTPWSSSHQAPSGLYRGMPRARCEPPLSVWGP